MNPPTDAGGPRQITLSERILLFLSRKPESKDYAIGHDHWTPDGALAQFCRCFPNFMSRVVGKEILDFGCGTGFQSVALVKKGAKRVVGIDIEKYYVEKARQFAAEAGVTERTEFVSRFEDSLGGRFDLVICQNSMEHFYDPAGALKQMRTALRPEGVLLLTFGPPWFAPYGSHAQYFVRVPWINILFDERTVMSVRNRFRPDGASTYEQGGLNQMTVKKFERIVRDAGMRLDYRKYDCVKGMNFLGNLPAIRELFVNQISCALIRVEK